jgi:hypothetical protein
MPVSRDSNQKSVVRKKNSTRFRGSDQSTWIEKDGSVLLHSGKPGEIGVSAGRVHNDEIVGLLDRTDRLRETGEFDRLPLIR